MARPFFSVCMIFFTGLFVRGYAGGTQDAHIRNPEMFATDLEIQYCIQELPSAFVYVLSNGQIHPEYQGDFRILKQSFAPSVNDFFRQNIHAKSFIIEKIERNQVPDINLSFPAQWQKSESVLGELLLDGENFLALGFRTHDVVYYRYDGINPLFDHGSTYNTAVYKNPEGKLERVLERFLFYRWTGVSMGVHLDTYMFAVDTYTGLVFSYVKIGSWKTAFGVEIPTRYDPIDIYKSSTGNPRWFFEYDPVGYISSDGELVLYSWYEEQIAKKLEVQLFSEFPLGKSPYFDGFL